MRRHIRKLAERAPFGIDVYRKKLQRPRLILRVGALLLQRNEPDAADGPGRRHRQVSAVAAYRKIRDGKRFKRGGLEIRGRRRHAFGGNSRTRYGRRAYRTGKNMLRGNLVENRLTSRKTVERGRRRRIVDDSQPVRGQAFGGQLCRGRLCEISALHAF